ncbi:NINE protein [Aureimonas flava]|uniref:NINE protein n=1 Tax=Aureimonas flava TaxID=2320271 RepID=A0A3A1WMY3_9HYPH|nr:NINE protein [Aureimonas flava]RIY01944.1 NINE protein [Aureimonas flava]
MKSGPAAFVLWLCGLIGLCGLHRFYLGRPWTGLLWLLTVGIFGIGQIIDLFLLPSMIRQENLERRLDRMETRTVVR